MSHKKAHIRTHPATEAQEDADDEAEIARSLRKWKRATVYLGLALVVTLGATVPFSYGHSLHRYSDVIGEKILFLSGGLWLAVVYSAINALIMWNYLRGVKKVNKEYTSGDETDK